MSKRSKERKKGNETAKRHGCVLNRLSLLTGDVSRMDKGWKAREQGMGSRKF